MKTETEVAKFPLCQTSLPFAPWIEELYHEGITAGCDATHYCPNASVTRGQMAIFLTRAFPMP